MDESGAEISYELVMTALVLDEQGRMRPSLVPLEPEAFMD